MKSHLILFIICCFLRNYFINLKKNIKLPKLMPTVPRELEPHEVTYLIYLFN